MDAIPPGANLWERALSPLHPQRLEGGRIAALLLPITYSRKLPAEAVSQAAVLRRPANRRITGNDRRKATVVTMPMLPPRPAASCHDAPRREAA